MCSASQLRERLAVARDRVPGLVVLVVPLGVAGRVGGVRAVGDAGHVADAPRRARRRRAGRGCNSSTISSTVTIARAGGEHRLLLHARQAPQLHVAAPVGLLGVDDRDVRVQRLHRHQRLAGERAGDRLDRVGLVGQPGAGVAAQHGERQAGRAGHVPVGHPGVAVLLDLQRPRPAVLDGVAEAVQRPDPRVAAPGEDQLAHAARADQLVVDDVRRHPDQREVTAALPDHLMARRERDQVREPLHRDRVAVVHRVGDSLRERDDLRHVAPVLVFTQRYLFASAWSTGVRRTDARWWSTPNMQVGRLWPGTTLYTHP